MALSDAGDLRSIAPLDRSRLHIFVAGPGQGEGIALALPSSGWILVDGCRAVKRGSEDSYPLEHIHRDFRSGDDDKVELLVLTHPHADHAQGFAELIQRFDPRRIAVTGTLNPQRTLAQEAHSLESHRTTRTTGQALKTGIVLRALRAINTWAETDGNELIASCDGQTLLERDGLSVVARAPDEGLLRGWLNAEEMGAMMATAANALSTVIELSFGGRIIVLGGDLPVTAGGAPVPTGWDLVITNHPHLVHHDVLKVPHHGSREALHPDLVGRMEKTRAWCLTPFNSSSLPRMDEDDGVDVLLSGESPIMLTAMSLSRRLQVAHETGRITPSELGAATEALRGGAPFALGDTVWRAGSALEPLDAVWCVAVGSNGELVHRWRGRAAVEIHAPPPPPKPARSSPKSMKSIRNV